MKTIADYFHYNYQCPYITGTREHIVNCEAGCARFTTVADCRRFLRKYCASENQNWKNCSLAQARTEAIENQIRIRKDIAIWQKKQK